ncbi:HAAS signaling domain-containing protein [Parasporobacterium paucivorans]|uniref:DUF1700 domain-containing protein n=1 Tax=Parasporobacterium paucivorans DSM 15970 TaxID=1122934 RepID=A0A1M6J222_9FIRM|nr:DUF1700 domain-containing protein [Parasporobacterium paucivorans]SHJ40736.1 Protein of unknown function [Parasporobacterium paucivorans DSM 15970]
MRKDEFLKLLEEALAGAASAGEIKSQREYYNEYIEGEKRTGKKEEEIIDNLGAPELIAKTILDAKERMGTAYSEGETYHQEEKRSWRVSGVNTWYGKLLGIVFAVVAVILLLLLIGGAITILVQIALPLFVILVIIALVNVLRQK